MYKIVVYACRMKLGKFFCRKFRDMRSFGTPILLCAALSVSQAGAQSRMDAERILQRGPSAGYLWVVFTGISSASIAQEKAILTASDALSLPGGKQALVTYWSTENLTVAWGGSSIIRCIDYFDEFMQPAGAACSVPRAAP